MKPRELERLIKAEGWIEAPDLGKGSHRVYRHPARPGIITIPWHARDIPRGTTHNILKQAGLKQAGFKG
ncbi:MAG: type II toxin-antitoxin system HicA family toxin [Candidatus Lambdaproteobacteria bacterium]|nr:type II toxin-antitoxin system HicA family toxin [Candidatus Lambdaproteobacteria bacterium]